MKTVGDFLQNRPLRYINANHSVLEAASYMTRYSIGAVCVLQDNQLVGIFSERDLVQRVVAAGKDPRTTKVSEVMTHELVIGHADEEISRCIERMVKAKVRHLPIVSQDLFLGSISIMELMQEQLRDLKFEVRALTEYVYHVPPQT